MRELVFGAALAFACLGATWASADGVRHISDGHSTMGPGQGGWTMNFSTNKAFTSESASVVSRANVSSATVLSPTKEVVDLHGNLGRHDLTRLWAWRLRRNSDADCVFVSIDTFAGDLWRPGCK
jgi:hypothetical protein